MSHLYEMREKLLQGEIGELFLDDYFRRWYRIMPATPYQQRLGIDRLFFRRDNGIEYAIEYKCDATSARTGNAFIETVSVDNQDKPGWAIYCQADFIIYFVDGCGPAYVIRPEQIREKLPAWQSQYPSRAIPNKGYKTIGLLVPLTQLKPISQIVLPIMRN